MFRYALNLGLVATVTTIAACSGAEQLSPAPSGRIGSTPGPDTAIVIGGPTTTPPPPIVPSFTLTGTVAGHEAGPDTTKVVAVPNASVTLVMIAGVNGDTLRPHVTVTSTSTDAAGAFRLDNLAPAYYRIDVTAPAGSPYANGGWSIGPARQAEVSVAINLWRKP